MPIRFPCINPSNSSVWPNEDGAAASPVNLKVIAPILRGPNGKQERNPEVDAAMTTLRLDQPGARLDAESVSNILCTHGTAQEIDALFALHRAGVLNLNPRLPGPGCMSTLLGRKKALPLSPSQPSFAHILAHQGKTGDASEDLPSLEDRFAKLRDAGLDLDMRSCNNRTPLHVALTTQNLDATLALIDLEVDLEAQDHQHNTPLMLALRVCFLDGVKALINRHAKTQTAIHVAAANSNAACIKALLEADPNLVSVVQSGLEPLHRAAGAGNVETTRALIEAGAEINKSVTPDGYSPLLLAAVSGQVNTILVLAEKGAVLDLAHTTSLATALHVAARLNRHDVVEALVAAGANINSLDANGSTPLYYAASERAYEAAKALVRQGADVTAANPKGHRPLTIAGDNGDTSMCLLLRKAGDKGPYTLRDRSPDGGA